MAHVWSLFSGAMGLDLGLEAAGLSPELAVEIDPRFCTTIRANRPDVAVVEGDVRNLRRADLHASVGHNEEIDLMVGGPPCQSFSTGGKRVGLNDPRGNLIFEYLRLVGDVRPRYFLLENVANLVTAALRHRPIQDRPGKRWNLASYSHENHALSVDGAPPPLEPDELSGSAITFLLETAISELSYSISFGVFNAAEFGAAQNRYRFVMFGARDDAAPELPEATHGEGEGLRPYRTLKEAIGDLVHDPGPGARYGDKYVEYFDQVPPGGNWRSLPVEVAKEAMGERSFSAGGGKTGFFRRLSWDAPSPTITGKPNRKGSGMCHPEVTRPLSVWECARIQGFPDSWEFSGSTHHQYLQIGNAVPVALGSGVGGTLRAAIDGTAQAESRGIDEMLDIATTKLRQSARNRRTKSA